MSPLSQRSSCVARGIVQSGADSRVKEKRIRRMRQGDALRSGGRDEEDAAPGLERDQEVVLLAIVAFGDRHAVPKLAENTRPALCDDAIAIARAWWCGGDETDSQRGSSIGQLQIQNSPYRAWPYRFGNLSYFTHSGPVRVGASDEMVESPLPLPASGAFLRVD